jgi:hypothetical protein
MSQGGGAYPAQTCPNKSPPDVVAVMTQEDLDKQSQTEQDLLEAYLSIPTDMDRISLDVAQFVTGNFFSIILLLVDL